MQAPISTMERKEYAVKRLCLRRIFCAATFDWCPCQLHPLCKKELLCEPCCQRTAPIRHHSLDATFITACFHPTVFQYPWTAMEAEEQTKKNKRSVLISDLLSTMAASACFLHANQPLSHRLHNSLQMWRAALLLKQQFSLIAC